MANGNNQTSIGKILFYWFLSTVGSIVVGVLFANPIKSVFDYVTAGNARVSFDFQAEQGCPSGRLKDILAVSDIIPKDGAENLIICDDRKLYTTETRQFSDLASKFKGCLHYMPGSPNVMMLRRKSDALCTVPGRTTIICDGTKARETYGGFDDTFEPPDCDPETLRQFGFLN